MGRLTRVRVESRVYIARFFGTVPQNKPYLAVLAFMHDSQHSPKSFPRYNLKYFNNNISQKYLKDSFLTICSPKKCYSDKKNCATSSL